MMVQMLKEVGCGKPWNDSNMLGDQLAKIAQVHVLAHILSFRVQLRKKSGSVAVVNDSKFGGTAIPIVTHGTTTPSKRWANLIA